MASYIGTATSRVDGSQRSPARQNMRPSLTFLDSLYGSIVTSTITKGHITRIDASAAMRVKGVLTVLTHENRPPHGGQ